MYYDRGQRAKGTGSARGLLEDQVLPLSSHTSSPAPTAADRTSQNRGSQNKGEIAMNRFRRVDMQSLHCNVAFFPHARIRRRGSQGWGEGGVAETDIFQRFAAAVEHWNRPETIGGSGV